MDAAALLCNICPRKPRFSDVSHLLTHVSSKAHLSHYFKLQVRSHQEPQAVILLDEYDRWYKANNLAKLLSDRLSSKDARRKKNQGKIAAQDKSCSIKSHGYRSPPAPACPLLDIPPPVYLDPRLVAPYSNIEHKDSNQRSSVSANCITVAAASNHPPHVHAELDYPLHPTLSSHTLIETEAHQWKQEPVFDSDDEGASALQRMPTWTKTLGRTAEMASQLLDQHLVYDPFVDDTESEVDKERVDEIARLKGVFWPGMDIFDSATEQMRRKRNQKKDESTLRMMEKTSMGVAPTELVFSPTGILRKQRVISGNVEDSSPLKGETPIPKRRMTRPKRVLSQSDPNVQHKRDRKRKKKVIKRGPTTVKEVFGHRGLHSARGASIEEPTCGGNHLPRGKSTDDFVLTFGGNDTRSSNELKVFCDTPDQDMSAPKDKYCEDGLQYELSAPSDFFLQQEAMTNRTPNSVLSANYISEFTERLCRFTTDKENIEPLLNVHGRIDPLVGWHSPTTERHLVSDATSYQSQVLFSNGQRIGLNMFDGQHGHAGYSYNPLAASFPKPPTDENPIYTTDANSSLASQGVIRATSPEATISDIEEEDFERLYLDGSIY
ncbi:hypothetical protein ETB97_003740 [Aspergillus alliaceus]|uniref:Uncharacterized protein n=1 Tax=Petromyces alliaceus TaxID=209559 RepID=A0A8H6AE20_PETAA|nr:hypothetical protein ETB97_003740 [Aspergillus burnettii]